MLSLYFLFFFVFNSFAICDFPHNPPVLCLKAKVISVKKINSPKYKCYIKTEVSSFLRPAGTYAYNSNLEKVLHKDALPLSKKNIDFYSAKNCDKENILTMLEYNCSDKDSSLKDYDLVDVHKTRTLILDQWTQKSVPIDCSMLLPK